jgi:hypothetical protein
MRFVEGETGSCNETYVTFDVDGTEEVSIKVEEAIDIKDEIPEATSFPPIKTEHEVRLHGVCVRLWWQLMLLGNLWRQQGSCEITLNYSLFCVILSMPYTF